MINGRYAFPVCAWRTTMVHNGIRAVIVGAVIMIGCLGAAYAAPIAPAAMTELSNPPVKLVSFWGRAFPWGYAYYPGQCYTYIPVDTPTGQVWRRVWICSDTRGPQYGNGYVGRF
jgi:hypothetical protein